MTPLTSRSFVPSSPREAAFRAAALASWRMISVDLVFRLKPISEVVPVFMAPVEPQFVRSLGDLFFQTDVGVRVKKRGGRFAGRLLFHEANSRQKAKQSQPEPQKSAKRFRDASIPARS